STEGRLDLAQHASKVDRLSGESTQVLRRADVRQSLAPILRAQVEGGCAAAVVDDVEVDLIEQQLTNQRDVTAYQRNELCEVVDVASKEDATEPRELLRAGLAEIGDAHVRRRKAEIALGDARQRGSRTGHGRQHQRAGGEVEATRQSGDAQPVGLGRPGGLAHLPVDVKSGEGHAVVREASSESVDDQVTHGTVGRREVEVEREPTVEPEDELPQ